MLKINGIQLKFVYLVRLQSNRYATLNPKNLKNTSKFECQGVTLIAYIGKVYFWPFSNFKLLFVFPSSNTLKLCSCHFVVFTRRPKGVIESTSIYWCYFLLSSHQLNSLPFSYIISISGTIGAEENCGLRHCLIKSCVLRHANLIILRSAETPTSLCTTVPIFKKFQLNKKAFVSISQLTIWKLAIVQCNNILKFQNFLVGIQRGPEANESSLDSSLF